MLLLSRELCGTDPGVGICNRLLENSETPLGSETNDQRLGLEIPIMIFSLVSKNPG